MKQPKMRVTSTQGKDWGYKRVVSMHWDNNERLWLVNIDFMESGNSNDFLSLYNHTGEFISSQGNLKGELVFE